MASFRFLFLPFEQTGTLSFCHWNTAGKTSDEAVPDLAGCLAGKQEYRAVILNTDALGDDEHCPRPDAKNPFDYTRVDAQTSPHESPVPLIRLTHILAGYERLPKRVFEPGVEFFDADANQTVRMTVNDFETFCRNSPSAQERFQNEKPDPVCIEIEQNPDDIRMHETLSARYAPVGPRPQEILLISLRKVRAQDEKERAVKAWRVPFETQSSAFWEKNKYPACCRFLYADIDDNDALKAERDLTAFWFSVITLAANTVPNAFLQAYRLYRVSVGVDADKLKSLLCRHIAKLGKAKEYLQTELGKIPKVTFYKDEEVVKPQHVPVIVEDDDERNVMRNPNSEDAGGKTGDALEQNVREHRAEINDGARNARRAIDRAAQSMRAQVNAFSDSPAELDPLQFERLKNDIVRLETEVLSTRPHNRSDDRKTAAAVEAIEKELALKQGSLIGRDTKIKAFAAASIIVLLGFAPYLSEIFKRYPLTDAVWVLALIVAAFVACITAIGGHWALSIHENKEKSLIKTITDRAGDIKKDRSDTVGEYTSYFSGACTLMYANALLRNAKVCKDGANHRKRVLYEHIEAADSAQKRDEQWLKAYEKQADESEFPEPPDCINPDIAPHANPFYWLPACADGDPIELNQSGETLTPPYDFIQSISIERVEIFDPIQGVSA